MAKPAGTILTILLSLAAFLGSGAYAVLSMADFRAARRGFWATAVSFAAIGLVLGIMTTWPLPIRIAVCAVFMAAAGGGLIWVLDYLKVRESLGIEASKPPDGNGFYMECNQQFGPLKISPVGLYFAMINETGGGGLSHLPVTDPSQEGQEYRILTDRMIEILQCKLNNYETLPALDTTLNLTVLFRKLVRSGIVVSEGEIVGQRIISLPFGQYAKIDPGAANSFTFYIANRSEISGIKVVFPKTISARLLNEDKARSFQLKSGATTFLLPERPLPSGMSR